jgi:hypothetical protein
VFGLTLREASFQPALSLKAFVKLITASRVVVTLYKLHMLFSRFTRPRTYKHLLDQDATALLELQDSAISRSPERV